MKVAINATPLLSPLTGVGNYTHHILKLLRQLGPEHSYKYYYGYFFSKRLFANDFTRGKIFQAKEQAKKIPGFWGLARKIKDDIAPYTFRPFDLYFEPNFIPIKIRARRVAVSVMDFSFKRHPEWHPRERIEYFEKNFFSRIARADRIIVISDFVRSEAINEFGLPAEKVRTVLLGFNQDVFKPIDPAQLFPVKARYSLPEKFILCVGSMEPRKNLLNLLKAYISLPNSLRGEFKLVFAGFKGWENREIMDLIAKVKDDVVYLGYVPDQDLGAIYNLASLFVYPSFYEGFGLPPLEAMACGCPVVVSRAASLPEVCGKAAVYVDPADYESIAAGMAKLMGDEALCKALRSAGLAQAAIFSWEKAAAGHLKIFEEMVKG